MSLADRFRKIFAAHPPERVAPRSPSNPGAQSTWDGPFISPGAPTTPIEPRAEPRLYDYGAGVNLNVLPRSEWNGAIPSFWKLWTAYQQIDVLQVMVTYRCQQIASLDWTLEKRKGSGFRTTNGDQARRLIELPDPQNDYSFEQWLSSVLLEVYVTDALTIQPVKNALGRTIALPQVDGQTIKPLIDAERGAPPAPPDPAYIQYIKGTAYTWFTSEEIIYRPFRPRSWCNYGTSRVEKILHTAALYAMHENYAADWFTQGNIPEAAALSDPDKAGDMAPAQFREWQEQMDQISGQNDSRRRTHLMPPFIKSLVNLKTFDFNRALPDWLIRSFCIEFGVPSYLFTSETNRSTAKEMNEALHDTPLRLDLMSIKRLMDKILRVSNFQELEFKWAKELDYSKEAIEGITLLVDKGIMRTDEARLYLSLAEGEEAAGAGSEDTELDEDLSPDAAENVDPNEDDDVPERESPVREQKANVVSISTKAKTSPRAGRRLGKRFTGLHAAKRAGLSTSLAGVVSKRLRQQQSRIMQEALERARARGKKVRGA